MASVIKISLLIVSALVFDTTPPSTPGDLFGQRLAPPLHGNLTPAGSLPAALLITGLDGSIMIPGAVIARPAATAGFLDGWARLHLI